MTKLDAIFAKNLVSLRKAKGYSSAESFAEELEISLRALQRYESGKRLPASELIEEMAAKLGVQAQDFFRAGEAVVIEKPQPMSVLARKLMSVPDEIYELAIKLNDPNNHAWGAVKAALEDEISYGEKVQKKKSNHSS